MFRLYQYSNDCVGHLVGYPSKGEWMIQQIKNGVWRNIQGPYSNEMDAKAEIERHILNGENYEIRRMDEKSS